MPIPEQNPDPPVEKAEPIQCWYCGADCTERFFSGYYQDGNVTHVMCPKCHKLAGDNIDSERGEWVE